MDETRISMNNRVPTVEGSWAKQTTARNAHKINSIGYAILAASVSDELNTNSYVIDVPDAGGVKTLTLQTALPSKYELARSLNNAIAEAYAPTTISLPQYVERSAGWYWTNPTQSEVTITFDNPTKQQLVLGNETSDEIKIGANSQTGPYFPDPRLGAVSQTLVLHPGQTYRIELPLAGSYRDGVLFRPNDEIAELTRPATTAEVSVSYPSINSKINVAATNSEIKITSTPTVLI